MIVQDINLHPSSDMLLKYSMGNTTEAESLIISCHIAYCAECKNEIRNVCETNAALNCSLCHETFVSGKSLNEHFRELTQFFLYCE